MSAHGNLHNENPYYTKNCFLLWKEVNIKAFHHEPKHKKNPKQMMYAPNKDFDQPGHSSSLISLHCSLNGYPRTQNFFRQTKTDNAQAYLSPLGAYIILLSCVLTSKVSVPHFARLAVFVDRFLWDYNGKPLFKDRHR